MANQATRVPRDTADHVDLDQVLLTPGTGFTSPEQVLTDDTLTDTQKIEVLRRLEYDASAVRVAEEEGMNGPENDLLERVLSALHTLTGGIDVEHTGPTKHCSLPQDIVATCAENDHKTRENTESSGVPTRLRPEAPVKFLTIAV